MREGRGAALATVIETWGSAPRPVGRAARGLRRRRHGRLGLRRLRRGRGGRRGARGAAGRPAAPARLRRHATTRPSRSGSPAAAASGCWSSRSGVGQGIDAALLERLVEARAAAQPRGLRGAARRLGAPAGDRPRRPALARRRRPRSSPTARASPATGFSACTTRRCRLVVVGAVHIAQALVPMARLAGYDVTVVDPREAFASDARFPGTPLMPRLARRRAGRASASTPAPPSSP